MQRIITYMALALLIALGSFIAYSPSGAAQGQAVSKQMTIEAANKIIQGIVPDARVISIQPSGITDFYEVAFFSNGKLNLGYIEPSGKLAIFGNLIDISKKMSITKSNFDKLMQDEKVLTALENFNRVDFASIALDDAILMGNSDAKYKAVVFDDPD